MGPPFDAGAIVPGDFADFGGAVDVGCTGVVVGVDVSALVVTVVGVTVVGVAVVEVVATEAFDPEPPHATDVAATTAATTTAIHLPGAAPSLIRVLACGLSRKEGLS